MNDLFLEKFFINPGIEYGIKSYLLKKEDQRYERIHTFEMHVIEALTIIYGEKSILLPYKIDNEKAFACNLLSYDLKEQSLEKFFQYMNDYYYFMKNIKSEIKATGLINEIEKILLEMIKKRNKRKAFKKEEIKQFDLIFNPLDGDLKKIKSLVSSNDGLFIKEWENSKNELTNTQVNLIAIKPTLLSREIYYKYGYDIRLIATLDNDEIEEINNIIHVEENKVFKLNEHKRFEFNKIVLSTGNGFVDKLMLVSIVATEIMIGIVILTYLGW